MIVFSPFVNGASANSSSDVYILKPNYLDCVDDSILECVLPISADVSHDFPIWVYNGQVQESYVFHQDIVDDSTGSIVYSDTSAITLAANDYATITFTPWNNWVNGTTYTINHYATRSDGSSVGNTRYFSAMFLDQIDVAILSDQTQGGAAIKDDLELLGLTYTQFEMQDWDAYFNSSWLSVFDKIVLPWQWEYSAKPINEGGDGYYEIIGSTENKTILENYMFSGGTLQLHLQEIDEYYNYSSATGESNLPFNMQIAPQYLNEVVYNDLSFTNLYHPIFEGLDVQYFQAFNVDSIVAETIINIGNTQQSNIPNICVDASQVGSTYSSLLQSDTIAQNSILALCGYGSGGLIATTIDVELNSERADSIDFPLLGNLLSHSISPHPSGFNSQGEGTDILMDGVSQTIHPGNGEYFVKYVKSDEELNFSYQTSTTETLQVDWTISGPHDWDGYQIQPGDTIHTEDSEPSVTFCKFDPVSSTGCQQDAQWEVTLYLHSDNGNSRILSITIMTDDSYADDFSPVANATIEERIEYMDKLEYLGTHNHSNQEWDLHRIYLNDSGGVTVFFDASDSYDPDSMTPSSGIFIHEWNVYFDKPYQDDLTIASKDYITNGNNGIWAYTFSNNTFELGSANETYIRIKLTVYDESGKWDHLFMFFSVAPADFFDPIIELNNTLNNTDYSQYSILINGNITSGDNNSEIVVEAAFNESYFNESAIYKYILKTERSYASTNGLSVGNSFEFTLSLEQYIETNSVGERKIYVRATDIQTGTQTELHWVKINFNPPDGDNDGIFDYFDDCLNTLNGLEIDEFGCAIDRDQDGIINSMDDCPDEFGNSSKGTDELRLFGCIDSDGDGWADILDAFANNILEWIDSDDDGVGDNSDAFPFDGTETHDDDLDGVGNNSDAFPFDGTETHDDDLDGVGDNSDAFPKDQNESLDTDGDGYGNNADDCILIAGNSSLDTVGCLDKDGDGWSDYNDAFVNDSAEWNDADGDGVGDNSDAFPNDSTETKDSDGDGVGDNEQLESEQKTQTNTIISITTILMITVSIVGVLYFKKKNTTSNESGKPNIELPVINQLEAPGSMQLEPIPLEVTSPTRESEWTDESGYTWRKMSDGSTYWWDGKDWVLYDQ